MSVCLFLNPSPVLLAGDHHFVTDFFSSRYIIVHCFALCCATPHLSHFAISLYVSFYFFLSFPFLSFIGLSLSPLTAKCPRRHACRRGCGGALTRCFPVRQRAAAAAVPVVADSTAARVEENEVEAAGRQPSTRLPTRTITHPARKCKSPTITQTEQMETGAARVQQSS